MHDQSNKSAIRGCPYCDTLNSMRSGVTITGVHHDCRVVCNNRGKSVLIVCSEVRVHKNPD
jgi:hypothetical protein